MPAGRPRKNTFDRPDRKTIYFDRQTSWRLTKYADLLNRPISDVVNAVIKDYLDRVSNTENPSELRLNPNSKPRIGMHSRHTEIGDKQWANHNRKVSEKRRKAKFENETQRYNEKRAAWKEGYDAGLHVKNI